ncbi:TSL-kinase interacting protein [Trifolium pratense]|uniref:TSL-kinase interacting protein n=1 Tax=Trifolium pratense TaxID=57577 RepID=A0A2K3MDT2_TRIPR|nr:TSL-kinase interacting protein [Trifolium pratense]
MAVELDVAQGNVPMGGGSIQTLEPIEVFVFKRLWESASPSKIRAFVWQLLLNRVQTKDNLYKLKMLRTDQQTWLGFTLIIPPNLAISFAMWATCVTNKKEKAGMCLIWNAFIWVVWKRWNDSVFNNGTVTVEEMVEQIKVVSRQWFIGRIAKGPVDCM